MLHSRKAILLVEPLTAPGKEKGYVLAWLLNCKSERLVVNCDKLFETWRQLLMVTQASPSTLFLGALSNTVILECCSHLFVKDLKEKHLGFSWYNRLCSPPLTDEMPYDLIKCWQNLGSYSVSPYWTEPTQPCSINREALSYLICTSLSHWS